MVASILITGHTGFVGTNLIRAFQKDYDLFGLDIRQGDPTNVPPLPTEKTCSWDLMDELPEADTIIHLAGKAHDTANVSAPEEYFEVNLELTRRIFDHFLQSGAATFIFFSSVKAAADNAGGEALTEDRMPDPKTPYGQSKLAAEQYIIKNIFNENHDAFSTSAATSGFSGSPYLKTTGRRVYILRPCMIHGPGNKGNLNLLHKVVKRGIPWPLGAFENQRSFLSMDNLVFALRKLLDGNARPGIYQVADDEPVSTNELIRLMARSMNRKPRIWNLPAGFIRGMARAGDLLHLPLNSERLKKLTESYVVSNRRLKEALCVERMPVTATVGLLHTLSSFSPKDETQA